MFDSNRNENLNKNKDLEYRILLRFNNFCDQKIHLILYSIDLKSKKFEYLQEECLDNISTFDIFFEKDY